MCIRDRARAIAATKNAGFAGYLAQNIAHFRLAKGLPLYGGFGLNITNPLAADTYKQLGLRAMTVLPEVPFNEMAAIVPGVPTWALVYGHMPLMLTRACPLQNAVSYTHLDVYKRQAQHRAHPAFGGFPVEVGPVEGVPVALHGNFVAVIDAGHAGQGEDHGVGQPQQPHAVVVPVPGQGAAALPVGLSLIHI